jgi:hypothetical protein
MKMKAILFQNIGKHQPNHTVSRSIISQHQLPLLGELQVPQRTSFHKKQKRERWRGKEDKGTNEEEERRESNEVMQRQPKK